MNFLEPIYKTIEMMNKRIADRSTFQGDDGLLHCSTCKQPLQTSVCLMSDEPQVVPCMCKCDIELKELEQKAEREQEKMIAVQRNRDNGITDTRYARYRWAYDDSPDSRESKLCRGYADSWEEMKAQNVGLLLTGTIGSGKTFYASCMANQLLDQGVRVIITTLSEAVNRLFGARDKAGEIRRLQDCDLLILDDFGAERGTDYSKEQVFSIIDARYRSGKPTVLTTNLTTEYMAAVTDLSYKRIYDRVNEMAPIQVTFSRESRRTNVADDKRQAAISALIKKVR